MAKSKDKSALDKISFEVYLTQYDYRTMDRALKATLGLHFGKIRFITYDMKTVNMSLQEEFNNNKSKINLAEIAKNMEIKGFDVWCGKDRKIRVENVDTIGFRIECSKPLIKFNKNYYKDYAIILVKLICDSYFNNFKGGNLKTAWNVLWDSINFGKSSNQNIRLKINKKENEIIWWLTNKESEIITPVPKY